jgi:hypothetical protein
MKQADLNRAVARATGETVSTIRRLGFLIAEADDCLAPSPGEHDPYAIDWDELEAQRYAENSRRPCNEPAAA